MKNILLILGVLLAFYWTWMIFDTGYKNGNRESLYWKYSYIGEKYNNDQTLKYNKEYITKGLCKYFNKNTGVIFYKGDLPDLMQVYSGEKPTVASTTKTPVSASIINCTNSVDGIGNIGIMGDFNKNPLLIDVN